MTETAPAAAPSPASPAEAGARSLPAGTVTFLFTDIEGSTRLLQRLGAAWEGVLEEHRRRVRAAIAAGGGTEVGTEGDSFFAAFPSPSGALLAAAEAQRALGSGGWPPDVSVPVRMGVHTGEVTVSAGDYVGLEVHRAARIAAAAHGGQVLVSSATLTLAADRLPPGTSVRDLGEHRLKDLSRPERLSQLVIEGLRNDFPRPRTLDTTPNNLPLQLTSFVGRESLVAEAKKLLASTRLLTLSGPGGTGKTRLALQIAAEVIDAFPDGVFFVPLGSVFTPDLVSSAIVAALGIAEGPAEPADRVIGYLRQRRTLLILDNFEQVLPAAPAVATILRMTEHVKILVTSRAVLRISGEHELPVPPLGLPDPRNLHTTASLSQYEAVQLFIERAMAARPDFMVTNENAPAVAEITARLDGLPLAIELAAARLRLLSPQAILARLGDRLGLLSGGARDLPERQQTLRAAIAWSYDLLPEPERRLFERLAAFSGGWSVEAAESVCAVGGPDAFDIFEGLSSLSEKSLVRAQDDAHGDARFLMLETIRAFALERFEASPVAPEIRGRHAAFFLDLAERLGSNLFGDDRSHRLNALEDDHDNLRAAIAWYGAEGDLASQARLLAALWRFWQMHGHLHEARRLFDAAIARDDREHLLEPAARRRLLSAGGGISYWQGDLRQTHTWYREAVELARAHEGPLEIANALYDLSFAALDSGPETWTEAMATASKAPLEEALAIFRAEGDDEGIARALWGLTNSYLFGSDLAEGEKVAREALAVNRRFGSAYGIGWALHSVGLIEAATGRLEDARRNLLEALDLFHAAGDMSGVTLIGGDIAVLASVLGEREHHVRAASAADHLIEVTGAALGRVSYQGAGLPVLPTGPERPEDEVPWAEGRLMDAEAFVAYLRATFGAPISSGQ